MEIRKIYISDDGEEFDSEEECLEHEQTVSSMNSVMLFDSRKRMISDPAPFVAFEKAVYVYIRDAEKAEAFLQWIRQECGYSVPEQLEDGELYFYDEQTNLFVNLEEKIRELKNLRDHIMVQVRAQELEDNGITLR